MIFKNLTPHPVTIYRTDGAGILCTFQPIKPALRLEEKDARISKDWIHREVKNGKYTLDTVLDNWMPEENYQLAVPIAVREYEAPSDWPGEAPGVGYIVSLPALLGMRAAGYTRRDMFAPDTGPGKWGAVRDEDGKVLGCYRLVAIGSLPEMYGGEGWTPEEWEKANAAPNR